tara:strand:- start:14720 stop:14989 length:270 start_codon:yes stop_codon:yes gene_type:complete
LQTWNDLRSIKGGVTADNVAARRRVDQHRKDTNRPRRALGIAGTRSGPEQIADIDAEVDRLPSSGDTPAQSMKIPRSFPASVASVLPAI